MIGKIYIDGEIGLETTPKTVRDEIAQYDNKVTEFEVYFNSEGGEVFDGYQIGSILKNIGKPTTAIISGLCASIATYAACCCDKVIMTPHGEFMIHDPMATAQGRAQDFRKVAEQLDRIKNEIIDRYMSKVSRKGITREQLAAKMDVESSMSPDEAFQMGFVDEIRDRLKAVAKLDINKFKMAKENEEENKLEKLFSNLEKRISNLVKKFNNTVEIALADGSMATSDAATSEALVESKITGPDGKPLAPGIYETADGYALTVDEAGTVTAYDPVAADSAKDKNKPADTAALEQKVKDLEAQLANKSKEAAVATAAVAKQTKEFTNSVKELKKELEALKTGTFGDDDDDNDNPEFRNEDKDGKRREFDPMAETLGKAWITSRSPELFNQN